MSRPSLSCQSAYRSTEQKEHPRGICPALEGIKKTAMSRWRIETIVAAERAYSALIESLRGLQRPEGVLNVHAGRSRPAHPQCRARLTEARIERYLDAGDYENALGARRPLSPPNSKTRPWRPVSREPWRRSGRRADAALAVATTSSAGRAYAALAEPRSYAGRLAPEAFFLPRGSRKRE